MRPRKSDHKVFVSDIAKASSHFGWAPKLASRTGLKNMVDWTKELIDA